jgi:hypothetical protein
VFLDDRAFWKQECWIWSVAVVLMHLSLVFKHITNENENLISTGCLLAVVRCDAKLRIVFQVAEKNSMRLLDF